MSQYPAMSAFASTPGLPPSARSHTHYAPRNPQEARQYETLWSAASPAGTPLQGAQAVQFFQRSGLDIQTLKSVWSVATPTSTMSKEQFFTAMRLIAMAQNHEPVTAERLQQLATHDLPSPAINGVQFPQLSGMAGGATAAHAPTSYNFVEGDLMKYQNLFSQHDKYGDGFVAAGEAAALFAQSGLPREVLRDLWNLLVPSHENKLNFKEFVVGMHLVVCVSKRHLPAPSTLPPALREYLQSGDRQPAPQAQTRRPSTDKISGMSAMDGMGGMGGDSYAAKSPAATTTSVPLRAADSGVSKDLLNVTGELVDQARRGAEAATTISTSTSMAASTLTELIQKLKAEKISLNAAIASAEDDSRALGAKLESSAQEIDGLRRELDGLRTRYREVQEQMMDDQAKAGGSDKEKEILLREIDHSRRTLDQLQASKGSLLAQVAETNARAAGYEGQTHAMNELATGYRQDIEGAKSDLQMMRALLGSYSESRTSLGSDVDGLQSQLRASKDRAERAERELQQKKSELDQLRSQRDQLDSEKKQLAAQLTQSNATSTPQPTASAPVKPVAAAPAPAIPAKTSSTPSVFGHDGKPNNGFGAAFDSDAFSTKSAPMQSTGSFEADPFDDVPSPKSAPAIPTQSPEPQQTDKKASDSFGSFGAFGDKSSAPAFDSDFGPSSPASGSSSPKPQEAAAATPAQTAPSEKPAPAIPATKPVEAPAAATPALPFDSFGDDAFGAFPDSADAFPSGNADGFSTDAFGAGGEAFGSTGGFGAGDANGFGNFADFGSTDGKAQGFDDAFGSANAFDNFK